MFDNYTRDRVDKERVEKQNKTKKQRQEFRDFIKSKFKENNYSTRFSYAEFAKKYSNSDKFKIIEKLREREQLYNEFIDELKKKERDEKQKEKDKAKDNFLELLKENQKLFDRHSRFNELREKFKDDPRYKALATAQKEDLFRNFISNLSSSSRHHRSSSHSKHHRESKSSSDKLKNDKSSNKSSNHRSSSSTIKSKDNKIDEQSKKESIIEEEKLNDNELDDGELNPSSVESNNDFKLEKEEIVSERSTTNEMTEEERKELDKQKRIELSLKEREKQVKREMESHLLEREKHRNMFKKQELIDDFNILLLDLIKNPDLSYREAKKLLKKDKRYETFDNLSRSDKENLFEQHINNLIKKKRKLFIELLEEIKDIKLNSEFRRIRKLIKDDQRYLALSERR